MASKSEEFRFGLSSMACRKSSIGVVGLTLAEMSHPPTTEASSAEVVLKASVRMDITIMVKITRANIASVRPVRNLALMG